MADKSLGLLCRKAVAGSLAYCVRDGDESGRLIFYTGKFGHLMTWWDFNQREAGMPSAYINGKCVCPSHSTTHIIDYDVINSTENVVYYENGDVGYFFTMSIVGVAGYCNFRCWEVGTDFEDADDEMKAEVVGTGSTVAQFEVLRKSNYTWTLRSL